MQDRGRNPCTLRTTVSWGEPCQSHGAHRGREGRTSHCHNAFAGRVCQASRDGCRTQLCNRMILICKACVLCQGACVLCVCVCVCVCVSGHSAGGFQAWHVVAHKTTIPGKQACSYMQLHVHVTCMGLCMSCVMYEPWHCHRRLRVVCFCSAGNAEDMYTSEGTGARRAPSPLLVSTSYNTWSHDMHYW